MEDAIAFVGKSFDTYLSILKGIRKFDLNIMLLCCHFPPNNHPSLSIGAFGFTIPYPSLPLLLFPITQAFGFT